MKSLSDVLLFVVNALTHKVYNTLSFLEALALLLCAIAIVGIVINGIDIRAEVRRAEETNGVRKTLSGGSWRRLISDAIKIIAFLTVAVIAAIAPPATVSQNRVRSAGTTLLLLVILGCLVFNQINDYLTRRAATVQLNELYDLHQRQRQMLADRGVYLTEEEGGDPE